MAAGTCCGCFNYRQGSVFAVGLGFVIGLVIVFLFVYLSFDPMSITQYVVRDKILGNESIAIFIFNSLVPLAAIGVLTNTSFTSGTATKVLALMIFIVGIMWFVFGGMLARRFSSGYMNWTPSGFMFKKYAKDPTQTKNLRYAVGAALVADSVAQNILLNNLPFPLNYFYWMGMWPIVPFLLFGMIPAVATWIALGPMMSLAGVMDAGGDGTEYVEAKKIHWFYSLSPADRDRVREGSDLEDGDDDDSDKSDSDNEGEAMVKKGNKKNNSGSQSVVVVQGRYAD